MNELTPIVDSPALIGTFRKFGDCGPVYQVMGLAPRRHTGEQMVRMMVIESGEELDYKVLEAVDDPLAD